MKACVVERGARRLPTSPAMWTMVSSVTHTVLHRRKTHGGGRLSMMAAAVCAGIDLFGDNDDLRQEHLHVCVIADKGHMC